MYCTNIHTPHIGKNRASTRPRAKPSNSTTRTNNKRVWGITRRDKEQTERDREEKNPLEEIHFVRIAILF